MFYFYPQKKKDVQDRVTQKENEVKIYQHLIKECQNFLQEKISEQENTLENVQEVCEYVMDTVKDLLLKEQQFYELDSHDKMKTPPFIVVPRADREILAIVKEMRE
jgi:predicted nucleotidyltransferase